MAKTGINIIDHLHELRTSQISERLGVKFVIFENKEELEETTEYGDMAKQEVGHEKAQGKQKPMQSIDEPVSKVGHRGPKVAKQGPNKHKEENIKEELEEEQEELEETTEYGYDAKQEVGHEKKQGKQKPMQSIDDPKNGSAAKPNMVKKGPNKHKEANMKESYSSELTEAVDTLLKTINEWKKRGK